MAERTCRRVPPAQRLKKCARVCARRCQLEPDYLFRLLKEFKQEKELKGFADTAASSPRRTSIYEGFDYDFTKVNPIGRGRLRNMEFLFCWLRHAHDPRDLRAAKREFGFKCVMTPIPPNL